MGAPRTSSSPRAQTKWTQPATRGGRLRRRNPRDVEAGEGCGSVSRSFAQARSHHSAIGHRYAARLTGEMAGLAERALQYLDDAAVFVSGSEVTRGKEAIVAAWQGFFGPDRPLMTWRPEIVEISADGELGFTRGPWQMRGVGEDGQPFERSGTFNSVWRRQEDGGWRIVFDAGCAAAGRTDGFGPWRRVGPRGGRPRRGGGRRPGAGDVRRGGARDPHRCRRTLRTARSPRRALPRGGQRRRVSRSGTRAPGRHQHRQAQADDEECRESGPLRGA